MEEHRARGCLRRQQGRGPGRPDQPERGAARGPCSATRCTATTALPTAATLGRCVDDATGNGHQRQHRALDARPRVDLPRSAGRADQPLRPGLGRFSRLHLVEGPRRTRASRTRTAPASARTTPRSTARIPTSTGRAAATTARTSSAAASCSVCRSSRTRARSIKHVLGDWQLTTIVQAGTGYPITVKLGVAGPQQASGHGQRHRASRTGPTTPTASRSTARSRGANRTQYLNPAAFTINGRVLGTNGNASRCVVRRPVHVPGGRLDLQEHPPGSEGDAAAASGGLQHLQQRELPVGLA